MGLVLLGIISVLSNLEAAAGEEPRNCKHPRPSNPKGPLSQFIAYQRASCSKGGNVLSLACRR